MGRGMGVPGSVPVIGDALASRVSESWCTNVCVCVSPGRNRGKSKGWELGLRTAVVDQSPII